MAKKAAKKAARKKAARKAKGGRPTKCRSTTIDILVEATRKGLSRAAACALAGIAESTWDNWMAEGADPNGAAEKREFVRRIAQARAELEAEALATVRKLAVGFEHVVTKHTVGPDGETVQTITKPVVDLRAAEMVLKVLDPERWSTKRLDVTSKGEQLEQGKILLIHPEDDV